MREQNKNKETKEYKMKMKLFYDLHEINHDRGRQFISHEKNYFMLEKTGYGFTLTNITNAGLKGKECQRLVVWTTRDSGNQPDWWSEFLSPKRETIFRDLKPVDLSKEEIDLFWKSIIPEKTLGFRYKNEKAVRFWPFHALQRIQPLKKAPQKWNLTAALRAIVNKQFRELKCIGVYTDDYAHDNAVNFQRGEITSHLTFARRIYENPSGWRVSKKPDEEGRISICCYGFDNNEFIPVIKNGNVT